METLEFTLVAKNLEKRAGKEKVPLENIISVREASQSEKNKFPKAVTALEVIEYNGRKQFRSCFLASNKTEALASQVPPKKPQA